MFFSSMPCVTSGIFSTTCQFTILGYDDLSLPLYDWGYILYLLHVRHLVILSVIHLFVLGLVMVQEETLIVCRRGYPTSGEFTILV